MAGNKIFTKIKLDQVKKNVFDLSHDVKLSCNMGYLVPTMIEECNPGEKYTIGCDTLVRFAPLVAPVMHRFDVSMHYWFVPYRLLWDNWEKFITNQKIAGLAPQIPSINVNTTTWDSNGLLDYLGIPAPPNPLSNEIVNAFFPAAYQFVYQEMYRDQNLIADVNYKLVDGDNTSNNDLFILRKRAWEHDYFTSALPFAQAGDPVDIPLGTVELVDDWANQGTPTFQNEDGSYSNGSLSVSTDPGNPIRLSSTPTKNQAYDPQGTLEVEPTTINSLRTAFRVQEWLEKAARAGRRYAESVLSYFGVKPEDARLQRPEYITGTQTPVMISEVLNTTGTEDLPQGNMSGHALSFATGKYGSYYTKEHGCIIGIMSIRPKTAYQNGIERSWFRKEPTDFYFPEFAHLGEQAIKTREIFAYTVASEDDWGYIPRYAEYRFKNNRVAGDFRDSLNFWHDGRIFSAAPSLNQQFIECTPDTRIFAVEDPDVQKMYVNVYNKIRAVRPMPFYGTPKF